MNYFLLFLCCTVPVLAELIVDELFWNVGKSDKPWSTIIRAFVMVIVAFVVQNGLNDNWWWAALLLLVAFHFAFFQYAINWIRCEPWYYLSDKGFDKLFGRMPLIGRVSLQAWVLLTVLIIYLTLNQTINVGAEMPFNLPKWYPR